MSSLALVDLAALRTELAHDPLAVWLDWLPQALDEALNTERNGNLPRFLQALERLFDLLQMSAVVPGHAVSVLMQGLLQRLARADERITALPVLRGQRRKHLQQPGALIREGQQRGLKVHL